LFLLFSEELIWVWHPDAALRGRVLSGADQVRIPRVRFTTTRWPCPHDFPVYCIIPKPISCFNIDNHASHFWRSCVWRGYVPLPL